jgi:hypothetical protein
MARNYENRERSCRKYKFHLKKTMKNTVLIV